VVIRTEGIVMNFAQTFKTLRKLKHKTQEGVAKDLSVSKSTIAMWETNQRTPDFEKTEEIADYFNVDLDYLLGRKATTTRVPESTVESSSSTIKLTDDEKTLIEAYRSNDDTYRKMMEMIIFTYKQSKEE
jgi:transcriptional regulator with XRE-family HTH domain